MIGDCYQQPGQASGKGCADIEPHGGSPPHVPPTYNDYTTDLSGVVTDIRNAVTYVAGLTPTQTIAGDLTNADTITSPGCGSVNVIYVTGDVESDVNITGCPTDYFVFNVDGQYVGKGQPTLLGGVTGSNILWVFKGRLQNSGGNGIVGTMIFDTADGANNAGDNLDCYDCALLVLNGKLTTVSGVRFRWDPYTVYDYGDAPDSYGTLYSAVNGAARHKYVGDFFVVTNPATGEGTITPCTSGGQEVACLRLGANWDSETDGQPNTAATGDDTHGSPDDEDSVGAASLTLTRGLPATVLVTVNNQFNKTGYLQCWLDLDGNGVFGAGEAQHGAPQGVPASTTNGSYSLSFGTVPASSTSSTYLRCRVSTDAASIANAVTLIPPPAPTPATGDPIFPLEKASYQLNDQWPDGEVEDYAVTIQSAGSIGNYVWLDENSDGYQDAGEPGLPNVTVKLYNATGGLVATTVTDAQGGYLFTDLPPGTYYVDVLDGTGNQGYTLPFPGMTQTPPSNLPGADFGNQNQGTTSIPGGGGLTGYPVTIGGGQPLETLTADFGYNNNPQPCVDDPSDSLLCTNLTATIGDRVWIDADGGGVQDPEEAGIAGVTVQLFGPGPDGVFNPGVDGIYGTSDDDSGAPLATDVTDANGNYLFDGLAAGAYVVQVDASSLPVGYTQTGDPDHFGTSGSVNDNQTTTPVILAPGDVFLNADFGYEPSQYGDIGDYVWLDANADGVQDGSEYGIPRVTVALIRDSNGNGFWDSGEPIIATTVTGAAGNYLFPGLPVTEWHRDRRLPGVGE